MRWVVLVAACGGAAAHPAVTTNGPSVAADPRVGEIEGEIVDAKTGEPLTVSIHVMRGGASIAGTYANAQGYFRMRDLAPDHYDLDIWWADLQDAHARVHVRDVTVEPGRSSTIDWKLDKTAGDVSVAWRPAPAKRHHEPRMSPGHGAIVGVAMSANAHEPVPADGLGVILQRGDGHLLSTTSDPRGDFFFDDVAPGDYKVGYGTPGAIGPLGTLHVTTGQVTSADVAIPEGEE